MANKSNNICHELSHDQKSASFLGYLIGYFNARGGNEENKKEIETEMMYRFCKKHNIPMDEKLIEQMSNIADLVLLEQFNSIITELMQEDWKSKEIEA